MDNKEKLKISSQSTFYLILVENRDISISVLNFTLNFKGTYVRCDLLYSL